MPDHRLLGLHRNPADLFDQFLDAPETLVLEVRDLDAVEVLQSGYYRMERCVAGALAEAVDRCGERRKAVKHAADRVDRRHVEVVMKVRNELDAGEGILQRAAVVPRG